MLSANPAAPPTPGAADGGGHARDVVLVLTFSEPVRSAGADTGLVLTVASQSGADGQWAVAVDGPEVTFNGTEVVLVQLLPPYFLRAGQDAEAYTISAPPGAFVDYADAPNPFAGGVLLDVTVVSHAANALATPAVASAGQLETVAVGFDLYTPLAFADEIIVSFPTALADGSPFPAGAGAVQLPEQLMTSFEPGPPFTAGVLYADRETNSVVITDLEGVVGPDGSSVPAAGVVQRIELQFRGIQLPSLYGTLSPYTVSVRYAAGGPDAVCTAAGPRLGNLQVPRFVVGAGDGGGFVTEYAAQVFETDGRAAPLPDARFAPVEVLTVRAVDADQLPGADVVYSMDTSEAAAVARQYFTLDRNTGVISTRIPIDADDPATPAVIDFVVVAVDGSPPFRAANATITITIADINDNAPAFSLPRDAASAAALPYYAAVVHEDAVVAGAGLLFVEAADGDSGVNSQIVYTLGANASAAAERHFEVDPSTGEIRIVELFATAVAASLNHHHVVVPVLATDQAADPADRRTDQVAVSISFIGDQDLSYMTVSSVGKLDPATFAAVIESAVCPTGSCSAVVYNTSVADSSTETTVAYYVRAKAADVAASELEAAQATALGVGGGALALDLVAPADMAEILSSAPGQKALAGSSSAGGFTFVSMGSTGELDTVAAAADPYGGLTLPGLIAVSAGALFCLVSTIIAILWSRRSQKETEQILRHSMYMDPQPFSPHHAPTQFLTGYPSAASFGVPPPRASRWIGPDAGWPSSPYGTPFALAQSPPMPGGGIPRTSMVQARNGSMVQMDDYIDIAQPQQQQQQQQQQQPYYVPHQRPSMPWAGDTSHNPMMAGSPGRAASSPMMMMPMPMMMPGQQQQMQMQQRWSEQPQMVRSPAPRPLVMRTSVPMVSPQSQPQRWSQTGPPQQEWDTVNNALFRQSTQFDPGVSSTNVDDWGTSTQALNMHAAGRPAQQLAPPQDRNSPENVDYAELDFDLTGRPPVAVQPVQVPNSTGQVQRTSMPQLHGMTPAEAGDAERMLMNEGDAQYFDQNFDGLANSNGNGNNWSTMQGADFEMGATEYADVNGDAGFQEPQQATAWTNPGNGNSY